MPVFFRVGQQIKEFKIYRKNPKQDNKGRVTYSNDIEEIGSFNGSISKYKQSEGKNWNDKESFRQFEHPVSHTIVVRGKCKVQAEDIIVLDNDKYYVCSKDNPSGLGIFEIIYCEKQIGAGKYV